MVTIPIGDKWTIEQALMLADMIDHQRKRSEGWDVMIVSKFPPLTTIHVPTVLGLFAWTANSIKKKMIIESAAFDYGGGWCTPGDVARNYLAIKFPKRRARMTTKQYQKIVPNRPQTPVYCHPCELEEAVYVDIKGAYWSILSALGWDVNYNPGVFLSPQSNVDDFPFPEHKMARNCLVSCGLSGSMRLWTGEQLITRKKPNRFINLMLWKVVQDVLHGCALDAISAGAVYAYTDGFIVSAEKAGAVMSAIEAWGFSTGVKHSGKASVRGPADYNFPDYRTKVRPRRKTTEFSNLYPVERDWLRTRLSRFSEVAQKRRLKA